ncbi:hypothetical protein EVAR_55874_1 [Eumeta japonica]|uniref:Uncharacterized protein n=1 Tax=Eumeta variegata TaxID=151549 RepID=A0A4C1YKR3_EUMVA|nr:hypothetical protein EVAR_55874_1 [Eumeta japonica]
MAAPLVNSVGTENGTMESESKSDGERMNLEKQWLHYGQRQMRSGPRGIRKGGCARVTSRRRCYPTGGGPRARRAGRLRRGSGGRRDRDAFVSSRLALASPRFT